MTDLQKLTYCGISDYFIKNNGVLIRDENDTLIFRADFITDNNFLVSPTISKKVLLVPHDDVIDDIYNHFRLPVILITSDGVMIVVVTGKEGDAGDYVQSVCIMMRSLDMGETFSTPEIIIDNNHIDPASRVHADMLLEDKVTGDIFLFGYTADSHIQGPVIGVDISADYINDIFYIKSTDKGVTWSEKVSLKTLLMTDALSNAFQASSSTVGLQLQDGTLVVSLYDVRKVDNLNVAGDDWSMRSIIIYSPDHGDTWIRTNELPAISNEATLQVYENEIYITARQYLVNAKRQFKTSDLGLTWNVGKGDNKLLGFQTQTGSLKVKNTYLYTCPASVTDRSLATLHITKNMRDFTKFLLIDAESIMGYTCLAAYENKLFLIYEKSDGIWLVDLSEYLKYID